MSVIVVLKREMWLNVRNVKSSLLNRSVSVLRLKSEFVWNNSARFAMRKRLSVKRKGMRAKWSDRLKRKFELLSEWIVRL